MALVERSDPSRGVAVLTFNRPEKLNALSTPLLREFNTHLEAVAQDPQVRAVVLTGEGPKAFVAGADIAEYAGGERGDFITFQLQGRSVNDALERLPKLTIAAVNGYALGGGFEIALCCDLMLVTPAARLGLPEGTLGLSPGGGGTQRLLRAVGRYVAADLLLTGRRLSGERAFALGLACELVEADGLLQAALSKAEYALKVAPLSLLEMKRLLREGADAALPTALSLEQEVLFRLFDTTDGREGLRAFVEKRAPRFEGK